MIGCVSFVRLLLIMAGIEPNPGPVDVRIFRYEYLLIEVGTQLLRKLFDKQVGPDFTKYLQTNPKQSKNLERLMHGHVIPSSYLKVLPPIDNQPHSSNFDICLLSILLRNVCGLSDAKYQVWHHPASDDMSLEADIGRLHRRRNDLMHRTGVYMSEKDLNVKWDELVLILQRLNLSVGSQDLQSLIEKAEQLPFDEELQNCWNENMDTWSWNESQIANALDDFKDGLDDLMTSQEKMMNAVTEICDTQSKILKHVLHDETELKKDEPDETHGPSKSKYKKSMGKTDNASIDEQGQQIYKRIDKGNETAKTNSPWANVVSDLTNYESIADELLTKNVLPDKSDLDLIIRKLGTKTPMSNRICTAICEYLKNKYEGVLKAFTAFSGKKDSVQSMVNTDKEDIIFVLLKKDDVKINCEEYRIYETQVGKIRPDMMKINRNISEFERNHSLPAEHLEKLEACVQQHSNMLFKKHSNLTMVSASWCKSHGLGKLSFTPCVALYVPIKGLIPLGEDPFDSSIGDYLVDVREGVFELFGDPNDYHKHLKMGCRITGGHRYQNGYFGGTLGTFVTHKNDANKIFVLTCAHVVLNNKGLEELVEKNDINYGNVNNEVYHPIAEPLHSFGQLSFATYCSGQNGSPGMEIAVIKMNTDRGPLDGSFPEATNYLEKGFDDSYPYKFSSGKCCDFDKLHRYPDVLKYGSVSKLREGKVRVRGTAVRDGPLFHKMNGTLLELHNQIEIESLGSEPFAERGDSGALVLARTNEGLAAVGIFEGRFNNVFIVTPMKVILDKLSTKVGLGKLVSFDENSTTSDEAQPGTEIVKVEVGRVAESSLPNARISNIEERLQRIENQMTNKLEPLSKDMKTVLQLLQHKQGSMSSQ